MVEIIDVLLNMLFILAIPVFFILVFCENRLRAAKKDKIKLTFEKEVRYRKSSIASISYVGIIYLLYLALYCVSNKSLLFCISVPTIIAYMMGTSLIVHNSKQIREVRRRKKLEKMFEEIQ